MKGKVSTILIIIIFLAGLSLLLYPTISNFYNSLHQSQAIVDYSQKVDALEEEAYRQMWTAAEAHNQALAERSNMFSLSGMMAEEYEELLDASGTGVMAYVEIPGIRVTLPIGHGTGEDVLQKSVGHLEWSSLPIGGESSHCVLSGHRGLPSSELFTNIDHMEIGDTFYIHVLGQTLEYEVDNIAVVEPNDFSLLGIEKGKDYVTLLTCTPYGINSHRLLVRGIRADTAEKDDSVLVIGNEVATVDMSVIVTVALAVLGIVAFFIILLLNRRKRKGGGKYAKT